MRFLDIYGKNEPNMLRMIMRKITYICRHIAIASPVLRIVQYASINCALTNQISAFPPPCLATSTTESGQDRAFKLNSPEDRGRATPWI